MKGTRNGGQPAGCGEVKNLWRWFAASRLMISLQKRLFLLLRAVEDKCEKNANLGRVDENRLSSLFLYRVKAYFKKQTRKGGFIMNKWLQGNALRKNEQWADSYRKWLLSQQPAEILNHTYEYTTREDILMCMEELSLQPKQAKAMLKSPCPLERCIWRIQRSWNGLYGHDSRVHRSRSR